MWYEKNGLIMLLTRSYIYKCSQHETLPDLNDFTRPVKQRYDVAQYSHIIVGHKQQVMAEWFQYEAQAQWFYSSSPSSCMFTSAGLANSQQLRCTHDSLYVNCILFLLLFFFKWMSHSTFNQLSKMSWRKCCKTHQKNAHIVAILLTKRLIWGGTWKACTAM